MNSFSLKNMIPQGAKGTSVNAPVVTESAGFRRRYLALIRRLLRSIATGVREQIIPAYQREITVDARESDWGAVRRLTNGLLQSFDQQTKEIIQAEGLRHTDQFVSATRAAFGVNLQGIVQSEDLADHLDRVALRNAGLVKGLTDDLVKRLQLATTNALIRGDGVATLRSLLKAEFDFSDARARLIADDQSSKLTADLNKIRHVQAGVTAYIWRTSRDERVRSRHAAINNTRYEYGQRTGAEDGLEPGQPIRCRCIAQAVVEFDEDQDGTTPAAPVAPAVTAPPVTETPAATTLPPSVQNLVTARDDAANYVLEQGRSDGNEHLVVLAANGALIDRVTSGQKSSVSFSPTISRALAADTARGPIAYHNHPGSTSLSFADLTATNLGFSEVWAIGHNGSRYRVKPAESGTVTSRIHRNAEVRLAGEIREKFEKELQDGSLTPAEINQVFSHLVNVRLHDRGLIDYHFELTEEQTAIVERIESRLN